MADVNTIAAIATPPGRGGVGIVRISGPMAFDIARLITKKTLKARYATYANFFDQDDTVLDQGLAIAFPLPNSFTGEDVVELQGHGGPVVMNMLLSRVVSLGARIARPGEFSERAFLNDKIDLSQAEAIADLIDSVSQQSVKGAMRSLQGEFSKAVRDLDQLVVSLRMFVEAAIDFPEEEIDFLSDTSLQNKITELRAQFKFVIKQSKEGALLRDGVSLVLVGRPNAGKSSLMNQLSGRESSIVTQVAGTTRDLIHEYIHIDGVPLKLVDTAGLRQDHEIVDEVEAEGMRRARTEIQQADGVLVIIDLLQHPNWQVEVEALLEGNTIDKVFVVLNKIDLVADLSADLKSKPDDYPHPVLTISAKHGDQIEALKIAIKAGLSIDLSEEGTYLARTRHVDALNRAYTHVLAGIEQLNVYHAGELLAEELRLAHTSLNEITGEFSSDDLLGQIFSSFCIGK